MARLHVTVGGKREITHELAKGIVIGRIPECDLMVDDREISRKHCRVDLTPEGWMITDLGSKNGIIVGGARVERHLLASGDVVRVGNATLTFSADQPASRPASKFPLGEDEFLAALSEGAPSPGELESGDTRRLADEADPQVSQMLRELAPDPSDYIAESATASDDSGASQAAASSLVAAPPTSEAPKYRGPTSWGASLTPAAPKAAAGRPPSSPTAPASKKEKKKKPAAPREPRNFLAPLKNLFAAGDTKEEAGGPWYRRKIPKPVFFAVVGALAIWVVWGFYTTLFSGPPRAHGRPLPPQPPIQAPND